MKNIEMSLLIMITITIAGCGIEQRSSGDVRYFLLDVQHPSGSIEATSVNCLHIRSCRVASQFAGRSLVYRTGSVLYEQDYYNLFLTNPDDQITDILRAWFRQSGMGDCVEDKQLERHTLEPRVDILCADFSDKEKPVAVMQMHVLLTQFDAGCSCTKTVLEKTFSAQTPLPLKPTAAQIVQGLSDSFATLLRQTEKALQ